MAEGGSTGSGTNSKEAAQLNSILQQQVAIMNQLKDSIAAMSSQMQEFCEASDKCFSSGKWQEVTKQVQDYGTQTRTSTQNTTQLAQKAKEASATFGKMAPVVGGVAGGLAGLRQGFQSLFANLKAGVNVLRTTAASLINVGRAILTIPFKMLQGLQEMASGGGGGGGGMAEALEELRKEFGFLGPTSDTIKDLTSSMAGFNETGLNAQKVFGTSAERMKMLTALAKEMGPQFAANAEEFKKNGGALLAYQKGLGLTGEQLAAVAIQGKKLGKDMGSVLNDMTKQALTMSKAFGLDAKVISKDMGKAMADVAHFGHLTTQQLGASVVYANKLGVSIDKLTGLMDQFDTFDKAAEATSKLNEQFGTNIDAMELMAEQDPAKKMEMLRKSFAATGKDMSQLSFQERKLIQQTTGMDAATMDAMLSHKDQGDMMDDITKKSKEAADTTLKQADAMKALAVQIERMVGGGGGGGGAKDFFSSFITGFTEGITSSREFQKVLMNLKQSMKIVGKLGFDLGRMFVDMFPGVKDILHGLAELFSPARYQKMANAVRKAFKDFSNGTIKDFGGLMDRLKEVFFNFFTEGEGPAKKILEGFKKFFNAVIKIIAGMVKWAADELANMITKLVEYLKNPSSIGGNVGMGGFLKMFEPLIDAAVYAFNKLAPLIVPLLLQLAKKIFEFITSEQFLGILKKAGPIIALVMFGPALLKSLTGALTGALTAAATDAVRNAFLGPGSKKISEMTGKQFSDLMSKATPPPAPAGAASPIIPPGTPSPQETAKAQATGKIIDGPTIIKLLLALAGIVTIGLVAFYVAAQMVSGMDRKQIENALLVLGGVAIAIIPAAFALSLLSKIPAAQLLSAIPALIAIGLVVPGMAALGVLIAEMVAKVELTSILKALLLITGMSIALIPAAFALATLAGAGGAVIAGAPAILAALVALGLLVPKMADLGVQLAEKVANLSLGSILKAIILLAGMSGALVIASGAMASLVAAGALAGGVPIMIAGIVAVGLIGFAMLELAPELASKAAKVPLMQVLKALAIMGAMAVAIVEVIASMALLVAAGVMSIFMGVIFDGLDAFKTVGLKMLEIAPELGKAASKAPLGPVLKALIILGLMAVAVVEVLAQMVLLAGAGILATLIGSILVGIEAFKLISVEMIKFAPTLGQVAQNIKVGEVSKALLVLGMMAVAIAENIVIMLGLTAMGALTLLAPIIVLGMVAFGLISYAMLKGAKAFDKVAAGIDATNVAKALFIMGLMSIAIAGSIVNLLLLSIMGALLPLVGLMLEGFLVFADVALGMMVFAKILDKAKSGINGDNVVAALAVIGVMAVAIAATAVSAMLLVAMSVFLLLWPVVKAGMKAFEWIIELLSEKMPGIVENINKIGALGIAPGGGPIQTLGVIAAALASVGDLVSPLVKLAILKKIGLDIDKTLPLLTDLVTKVSDQASKILVEIAKVPSGGMEEKAKAFGSIMQAIGALSEALAGSIKNLDFGWLDSADDKVKMMAQFDKVLKTMMDGLVGILKTIFEGISKISASKETLEAAKTVAEILGAVGKLAEGMNPPPALFEAIKDTIGQEGKIKTGLASIGSLAAVIGEQIGNILGIIADKLVPNLKGFKSFDKDTIASIATVLEAIAKVTAGLQPPPALMDALKDADPSKVYEIFNGMKTFFETAGPTINKAIDQISKSVPPMVKAITEVPLTPQQIESVKVIGPVIGSLASVIGAMVGPAQAFMSAASSSGGLFDNPKDFEAELGKLLRVFDAIKDKIGQLVGPGGPIMSLISSIGGMDPKQIESAAKIGPVIAAIAQVVTALSPKPEVLKAIEDASKDEAKYKSMMSGIEKVITLIGDNVSKMFAPIGPLFASISQHAITPEQIKLLEALSPIIQAVIKMTNDLISGMTKEGKYPDAGQIANIESFFGTVAVGMGKMFETINTQLDKILSKMMDLLAGLKKQNIKPDEAKAGVEIIKQALEMINTMTDVVGRIKNEMKVPDSDVPNPEPFKKALEGLGKLVDDLFGEKGAANKIIDLLSSPKLKEVAANKDGIAALMGAFDFIGKLPATLEGLKKAGGGGPDINVGAISKQINSIVEIISTSFTETNIDTLTKSLSTLQKLGAVKDKIADIDAAFKNVSALAQTIALAAGNADLGAVEGKGATLSTNMGKLGTALDQIGTASSQTGQAVSKIVSDFKVEALKKSFTELQNIAKAVQDLDDALANLGKIDLKQRIAKVAGGAGLDGGGVYTVKSKDVNINISLQVTMEAGGIEKVILQNSNSNIRRAFNLTADNLGKGGDDVSGAQTNIKNLARGDG